MHRTPGLLAFAALLLAGCGAATSPTELHLSEASGSERTWSRLLGAWSCEVGTSGQVVVLRFEHEADRPPVGWCDLPAQEVLGVPATVIGIDGDLVRVELDTLRAVFEGRLGMEQDRIEGNFVQDERVLDATARPVSLAELPYLAPRWNADGERELEYTYRPPQRVDDGWEVGRLDEESVRIVTGVMESVLSEQSEKVHGVVVAVNGALVMEEYFFGFHRERRHPLRSVTKSLASVLTGVALQQGYVSGVEAKLASFFPEVADEQDRDGRKREIALEHLLTMTSGLEGDDWKDGFAGGAEVEASPDWLATVLARRMVAEPGSRFAYSGSSLVALAGALEVASDTPLVEMAERHLFGPMGIEDVEWYTSQAGMAYLGSGLRLRPRDLAKVGQLFANGGRWGEAQLLPESWVVESVRPRRRVRSRGLDYGYLWWSREFRSAREGGETRAALASGLGGQLLCVVPERRLVIAIVAGNYGDESERLRNQSIDMAERLVDVSAE